MTWKSMNGPEIRSSLTFLAYFAFQISATKGALHDVTRGQRLSSATANMLLS